jgi:hypothetical protein
VLEKTSLCVGLSVAMLLHRPSGRAGALVGVLVLATLVPYGLPLLRALPAWDLAPQLLFPGSFATATWSHMALPAPLARQAAPTGEVQRAELLHDVPLAPALPGARHVGLELSERVRSAATVAALGGWLATHVLVKNDLLFAPPRDEVPWWRNRGR